MKVTLIGGLDRLVPHYRRAALRAGHELIVFNRYKAGMEARMSASDAVVLFTGMVSHMARDHAVEAARNFGVPVLQSHSAGLSSFRDALASL